MTNIQLIHKMDTFRIACKKGHFDVVELMVNSQFKDFGINLNTQPVNGMTHLTGGMKSWESGNPGISHLF